MQRLRFGICSAWQRIHGKPSLNAMSTEFLAHVDRFMMKLQNWVSKQKFRNANSFQENHTIHKIKFDDTVVFPTISNYYPRLYREFHKHLNSFNKKDESLQLNTICYPALRAACNNTSLREPGINDNPLESQ